MRKKSNIPRNTIAVFLLALYASTYVIGANCGLGMCFCHEDQAYAPKNAHSHSVHQPKDSSSGSHAHDTSTEHHPEASDDAHSHGSDENCCVKTSESLLGKDLILSGKHSFKGMALYKPFFALFYSPICDKFLASGTPLFRYKYPPPKIPDIRVFIQSFLN